MTRIYNFLFLQVFFKENQYEREVIIRVFGYVAYSQREVNT